MIFIHSIFLFYFSLLLLFTALFFPTWTCRFAGGWPSVVWLDRWCPFILLVALFGGWLSAEIWWRRLKICRRLGLGFGYSWAGPSPQKWASFPLMLNCNIRVFGHLVFELYLLYLGFRPLGVFSNLGWISLSPSP